MFIYGVVYIHVYNGCTTSCTYPCRLDRVTLWYGSFVSLAFFSSVFWCIWQ